MDQFLGQLLTFGFNFAPQGWATCSGQILSIQQNTALFSLLGTTFGGNGQTTFALPDLRGRTVRHAGSSAGPGLQQVLLGEVGGTETVTLTVNNLPSHNHTMAVAVNTNAGNSNVPTLNLAASTDAYSEDVTPNQFLKGVNSSIAGGGQPVQINNPYLVMNTCIALVGIYPSRN